jgi:curved DNA-binding protein CbpA
MESNNNNNNMTLVRARQILGLEEKFSFADLRAAFHQRALATHPDKCNNNNNSEVGSIY